MYRLIIATVVNIFLAGQVGAQGFTFDYNKDFGKILMQTKDRGGSLFYNRLLHRFNSNDETLTNFEVLALLIGFTDNEHFKPYDYLEIERRIYSLNGEGEFAEALRLADSLLSNVPVSQQALIEKSYSCFKLKQTDSSDYYMWKFRKIMRTMSLTGDGLTPETAIFSLGPADGQNFITKGLTGKIGTMGDGRDKNGNFVDILTAITTDEKTGKTREQVMYFQIQHAVNKMFEPGELDEATKDGKKKTFKVKKNGRVIFKN